LSQIAAFGQKRNLERNLERHLERHTAADDLDSGGAKTKFKVNISAIRILKDIEPYL